MQYIIAWMSVSSIYYHWKDRSEKSRQRMPNTDKLNWHSLTNLTVKFEEIFHSVYCYLSTLCYAVWIRLYSHIDIISSQPSSNFHPDSWGFIFSCPLCPLFFLGFCPFKDACINWQLVWITALLDCEDTKRWGPDHQAHGELASVLWKRW